MSKLQTIIWAVLILLSVRGGHAETLQHAIAMHGKPALAKGFDAFPYANPRAPQGGTLRLGRIGTFDSLNPFIVRGVTPDTIRGYVFESLLARSADEPFTLYALIARGIEVAEDRSWIVFHLHPGARFSDGTPITADDVRFSFDILRRKGRPYMRSHYSKVVRIETPSTQTVRFVFKAGADREIPLIMGLMPVLPRHANRPESFDKTTLQPMVGSGPYTISKVVAGGSITYARNPNYWGRDLPVRRGLFNFDVVHVDYFRSNAAFFEAFKTGAIDFRQENDPARWIDSYDFPAATSGAVRKYAFDTGLPAGMTGFVLNTRRAKFADQRVRQAMQLAFDARRINAQMFHGRYIRSASFFARSDLASTGRPASATEKRLLAPFAGAVRNDILAGTWRPPTANTGREQRANLKRAFQLLRAAGYQLQGRRLVKAGNGKPFTIEFLVTTRAQGRLALAFGDNLKRLGIATSIRQMEDSQYWARLGTFDFDVIQWTYRASLSPGNEQIHRWSSRYVDVERSFNYAGVKSAAVDRMIEAMLAAKQRPDFEAAVRAFDRVLLSGDYVIPLFHDPKQWVAASSKLAFPKRQPLFGFDLSTWWHRR